MKRWETGYNRQIKSHTATAQRHKTRQKRTDIHHHRWRESELQNAKRGKVVSKVDIILMHLQSGKLCFISNISLQNVDLLSSQLPLVRKGRLQHFPESANIFSQILQPSPTSAVPKPRAARAEARV